MLEKIILKLQNMGAFDFSYENILHSNVINFAVVIVFFALIFWKLKVGQKLNDAHSKEKQAIKDSEAGREKSIFELKTVKESVKKLGAELEKIAEDGKKIIADLKKLTKNELKDIEEGLERSAKKIFGIQEENIKHQAKTELAKKGVEIAENRLKDALLKDKKLHKKFINSAIDELDEIEIK